MARLADSSDEHIPLIITARLEQGVVIDSHYGLALDGILASQIRKEAAVGLELRRDGGRELDGGLHIKDPIDWPLPLAKCIPPGNQLDWHWMCSVGFLIDYSGKELRKQTPDTHRLSVRLDARRAHQVAVKVPATAGGASGRFRTRITPVLSIPAYAVQWRAVGAQKAIEELLIPVAAIGGRRGAGEGAVLEWSIAPWTGTTDPWSFAHCDNANSRPSRPMPLECAKQMPKDSYYEGTAGIRPPLLHRSRQRTLAIPVQL